MKVGIMRMKRRDLTRSEKAIRRQVMRSIVRVPPEAAKRFALAGGFAPNRAAFNHRTVPFGELRAAAVELDLELIPKLAAPMLRLDAANDRISVGQLQCEVGVPATDRIDERIDAEYLLSMLDDAPRLQFILRARTIGCMTLDQVAAAWAAREGVVTKLTRERIRTIQAKAERLVIRRLIERRAMSQRMARRSFDGFDREWLRWNGYPIERALRENS